MVKTLADENVCKGVKLLRGDDVAQALNISRALAYKWMASGVVPTVRVPGARSIRVPLAALEKWVESQTRGGQSTAA